MAIEHFKLQQTHGLIVCEPYKGPWLWNSYGNNGKAPVLLSFEPKIIVCDAAVPLGEGLRGMTLCDFLNPVVPLGKKGYIGMTLGAWLSRGACTLSNGFLKVDTRD